MTHRCENCGEPMSVDPAAAAQLRADRAVIEYRRRWGDHISVDTSAAYTTLAESRGLQLVDVIEAAAADRLADIVALPVVKRSKR